MSLYLLVLTEPSTVKIFSQTYCIICYNLLKVLNKLLICLLDHSNPKTLKFSQKFGNDCRKQSKWISLRISLTKCLVQFLKSIFLVFVSSDDVAFLIQHTMVVKVPVVGCTCVPGHIQIVLWVLIVDYYQSCCWVTDVGNHTVIVPFQNSIQNTHVSRIDFSLYSDILYRKDFVIILLKANAHSPWTSQVNTILSIFRVENMLKCHIESILNDFVPGGCTEECRVDGRIMVHTIDRTHKLIVSPHNLPHRINKHKSNINITPTHNVNQRVPKQICLVRFSSQLIIGHQYLRNHIFIEKFPPLR